MVVVADSVVGTGRRSDCEDDTGDARDALPGECAAWCRGEYGGAVGRLLDKGGILSEIMGMRTSRNVHMNTSNERHGDW